MSTSPGKKMAEIKEKRNDEKDQNYFSPPETATTSSKRMSISIASICDETSSPSFPVQADIAETKSLLQETSHWQMQSTESEENLDHLITKRVKLPSLTEIVTSRPWDKQQQQQQQQLPYATSSSHAYKKPETTPYGFATVQRPPPIRPPSQYGSTFPSFPRSENPSAYPTVYNNPTAYQKSQYNNSQYGYQKVYHMPQQPVPQQPLTQQQPLPQPIGTPPPTKYIKDPASNLISLASTAVMDSKRRRTRENLPKPVTRQLKQWLFTHHTNPYPTEQEKKKFCKELNLNLNQLNNWFINARRRYLKKVLMDSNEELEEQEGDSPNVPPELKEQWEKTMQTHIVQTRDDKEVNNK